MMIGGFFDVHSANWSDAEIDWYENFLEEQDVDIMAWGMGTQEIPAKWAGPMMDAFRKLDYLTTFG